MSLVMTPPDYSADPYRDLTQRIIEARVGYQRLCGFPPTVIHVNGPLRLALLGKGFAEGGEIAGMRIISSPESIADMAICSRDADLFKPLMVLPARTHETDGPGQVMGTGDWPYVNLGPPK
jgi:hypothetical protein